MPSLVLSSSNEAISNAERVCDAIRDHSARNHILTRRHAQSQKFRTYNIGDNISIGILAKLRETIAATRIIGKVLSRNGGVLSFLYKVKTELRILNHHVYARQLNWLTPTYNLCLGS